ncbi:MULTISPECIES: alternative ribosome rescue aminoacyl-tRNA hydrolase ArfB [unclassified Siphonobacter]|uniref:alternative ribosome rescue aminoacyl-tRNA hydrolase ArfB n=1 Tax=unclassified Siphonobacter TaxID=2635712 RepID=UPI000CC02F35|nr:MULTISPECIES: alternative ribosome rescue aminoacyl-tRNA hydrolase ArfB [unclassified Siphonobacter]MDQ1085742.1 ribosome-associated protein [Siphonobacter sp. SORGH_AS_1065]MDR6196011.1 ribosome-associated protein [Siphonobacter sp. SORGH_AS_0500]PKK37313.1 aminoacyl-tRNA hydrolase [Siphonobacter sp. SORGH_AS_0500]
MFDLSSELQFQTSRSSGPGGQNVNKVESKVEVRLNIPASQILNEEQKQKIQQRLKSQLTTEGDLVVTSQESRSQMKNKELAVKKLYAVLTKAFEEPRVRKATKPTKASTLERLQTKRVASERKASRSRKNWED